MKKITVLLLGLILAGNYAGSSSLAASLTVSPATVSNTYPGSITLLISNVPTGATVVVQRFIDLNTNSVIDGSDWLVQQFNLTDGQTGMAIAGVFPSSPVRRCPAAR